MGCTWEAQKITPVNMNRRKQLTKVAVVVLVITIVSWNAVQRFAIGKPEYYPWQSVFNLAAHIVGMLLVLRLAAWWLGRK